MWARARVSTAECPRSYITPESTGFVEEYAIFAAFGKADFQELPARLVDALLTLRAEEIQERNDGEQN